MSSTNKWLSAKLKNIKKFNLNDLHADISSVPCMGKLSREWGDKCSCHLKYLDFYFFRLVFADYLVQLISGFLEDIVNV